jgi:sulfur-oxidizing protein SoxY
MAGARSGATRIRLAKTQDVVAVAKMEDGSFRKAGATVKVTIGGCGG